MGSASVDLLVIGQGWTGNYVIAEAARQQITSIGTTRDGRNGTIAFDFNPDLADKTQFYRLPNAVTILLTFPILSEPAMDRFVDFYRDTRDQTVRKSPYWILLGTSGNFNPNPPDVWCDRNSALSNFSDRNKGENRLLSRFPGTSTILHLAGLYDGAERDPRNFINRIAPSLELLRVKKSVHYIHGVDTARAILAVHGKFVDIHSSEERWIIGNMRTYDWWEFLSGAIPTGWDLEKQGAPPCWGWVLQSMEACDVKGLPRDIVQLQRALDVREFWTRHGLMPLHTRL